MDFTCSTCRTSLSVSSAREAVRMVAQNEWDNTKTLVIECSNCGEPNVFEVPRTGSVVPSQAFAPSKYLGRAIQSVKPARALAAR